MIGFGKIGSSIAHHLALKGVKPSVFDRRALARLAGQNRLCRTPERSRLLRQSDVLFCATGDHSLDILDFRCLKSGCFVFSVTSSDDEMNLTFLESEYSSEAVTRHVTRFTSPNNTFFLVNRGNAVNFIHNAVLGGFIHLVRAEMMHALRLLSTGRHGPGIHEVSHALREELAQEWLAVFVDADGAL